MRLYLRSLLDKSTNLSIHWRASNNDSNLCDGQREHYLAILNNDSKYELSLLTMERIQDPHTRRSYIFALSQLLVADW